MKTEDEIRTWLVEAQKQLDESMDIYFRMIREDREESLQLWKHREAINRLPYVIGTLKWVLDLPLSD